MNAVELQKKLKNIRHAERAIVPDEAWVLRTRETLMMQVRNSVRVVKPSFGDRMRAFGASFIPKKLVAATRGPMLAFLSIFTIVSGVSIMSVSAAERAVPGDSLFSLKLGTEQIRILLTSGRADKLKLKTEFVLRRGQEIKDIAASDLPEKQARINEGASILKRDLDTVKKQLKEVSDNESPHQAAQSAKLIDKKSTELAHTLKDVKATMPADARVAVSAAEVAAVNTGMKAVQVMIDSKDKPDAQGVVTNEEIIQSISDKVQGLEGNIADATQKIVSSASGTTPIIVSPTSTSPLGQLESATASLTETKQLLVDNKLDEISDKLMETAQAVATIEVAADAALVAATASSTAAALAIPPFEKIGTASGTEMAPAAASSSAVTSTIRSASTSTTTSTTTTTITTTSTSR